MTSVIYSDYYIVTFLIKLGLKNQHIFRANTLSSTRKNPCKN